MFTKAPLTINPDNYELTGTKTVRPSEFDEEHFDF